MSAGFGRKGLEAGHAGGAATAGYTRSGFARHGPDIVPQPAADDDLARRREAFLASERQRRAESGEIEGGLSDIVRETPRPGSRDRSERNMLVAYVLWWFAAPIGAHRLYLGAIGSGFAMLVLFVMSFVMIFASPVVGLLLLGAWFLWFIVDAVLIPGMTRAANAPDVASVFT